MARRATIQSLQVTIGASATQFSSTNLPCRAVIVQNNAGHAMRVGDSTVTSGIGIALASGSPGGSATFPPLGGARDYNLQDFYVEGTQNDVLDVLVIW